MKTIRQTVEHEGGEIPDYHEMVWLGETLTGRDKSGRRHRHGREEFLLMVCNNPGCKGSGIVSVTALTDLFEEHRQETV